MTALFPQIDIPTRFEASGLAMSRGDNVLFENLSATVSSGDVLWVQGDNGIGKTTLLEAFAGISRPEAGRISWFSAESITSHNTVVAYQPHRSYAKVTLTTMEDLTFWAKLHHRTGLVEEVLEVAGLATREHVHTQNLSAGQRRRLALAKLIISNKPIWIMDEPGAAMDAIGIGLIDKLIEMHIKRGGSAVIASHASSRKLSANTRTLTLKPAS